MVTFDCGSLERLGDLEPAAKAARELVVIDHHISNSRYGTINVIDPNAAASGVLVRNGVTLAEVEGRIDVLRRTTEAEVTCVLKEEADGSVRVSLRSLGDVDVRRIAEAHQGGGHRFAAGFSSVLDIPTVVARIEAAL